MAFRIAPLNLPQGGVDYSAETRAAASLGQMLGNLPATLRASQEKQQKQQMLSELGQGVASGTLNYKDMAGKLFQAGDAASAFDVLKLGEASAQRKAGEDATRSMGDALKGYFSGGVGLGAPVSKTSNTTDSALPAVLINSESGGNWGARNNEVGAGGAVGHFGRAQFGQARLQEAANAGAIPQGTTPDQFRNSPDLQRAAEAWHVNDIDQNIKANGFDRLIGQSINGVPITLDGMRAVAHLGGNRGLQRFITSGGAYNPTDANGTSLMDYLQLGAGSQRTAQADMPASGATPVAMETGQDGFAIPGQPSMTGRTFDAITAGGKPLDPAFQSEGVSQPWMGTALRNAPGLGAPAQVAQAQPPMPPRRPYDLAADLPAPVASQAIAYLGQRRAPSPFADPTRDDAGALSGLVASEEARRGLTPGSDIMNPFEMFRGQSQPRPSAATPGTMTVPNPQADIPARGASPTVGTMPPSAVRVAANAGATAEPAANGRTEAAPNPVPSSDLPRPTNAQEAQDFRWTKQIESKQRQVGALVTALANPNLPANARGLGEIFLKQALEDSKAPDSVKEFTYARGMGWTTARTPAEYAAEKEKAKKNTAEDDVEARKAAAAKAGLKPGDAGYQGYLLTGKMPREDMGPLTATDKKAILEADDMVMVNRSAIDTLKQAKALSAQAYQGTAASIRGTIAGNLGSEAGKATMEYDNLVTTNALGQLKSIFGAAPTEGERKILLDIQGSANLPHDVRVKILDRGIAMAERRLAFNEQRASELRGGDYYKSPEKRSQANNPPPPPQAQDGQSRYQAAPSQPAPQPPRPPQPAQAPVRVQSPQEAMKLPRGTPIILPDGRIGEVP